VFNLSVAASPGLIPALLANPSVHPKTMNPQNPTDQYVLLIRGTHWNQGLSPAELQMFMTESYAWAARHGLLRGFQPLVASPTTA
jgi:hypothetical protein